MKKYHIILFAAAALSGCAKEGIGGTSEISTIVRHHSNPIPYAKVYIKYGARESPGTNTSVYDDSLTTDAQGHGHFEEMEKGDYYLFGSGYDSTISAIVIGGVPVKIKKGEDFEALVAVTE